MPSDIDETWDEDGAISTIEQNAARWLVLDDRGLTPAQREEFSRWLLADERHAEIYAELRETWGLLGRLQEGRPGVKVRLEPVASPAVVRPRRGKKILWIATTLATAAALALATFNWFHSMPGNSDIFATNASTEIGMLRRLPLPDGSVVQLNTDSAVAVQFNAVERRVRLVRGEAHFQVAKNPARPFIVSAGQVAVRAVGTAFDVRLRPQAVDVLVTEGKVRVNDLTDGRSLLAAPSSTEEQPLLVAGQRVSIPMGESSTALGRATVAAVPSAEMGQALAWQSKRLEFVSTPLSEMVAEFNRYNRHKLVIDDPRLATSRFGGTFAAGDHEELVRLLVADFGVVAERGENETKLRLAR